MNTADVMAVFGVGRWFVDQHRDELGGTKCGAYVVFPLTKVAEFFGVDKAEVAAAMEEATA